MGLHEDFGPFVGERLDAGRAGQGQVGPLTAPAAGRKKYDANGERHEQEE
jgi:hypothetical protein